MYIDGTKNFAYDAATHWNFKCPYPVSICAIGYGGKSSDDSEYDVKEHPAVALQQWQVALPPSPPLLPQHN
jgi:hypothetical protein